MNNNNSDLFYQNLGIDSNSSNKDYVLMLIRPSDENLAEVVSNKPENCDILCLKNKVSFGTLIFYGKTEQENMAYLLGFAFTLHAMRKYKKFVFVSGDLANPASSLASLATLETIPGVSSYNEEGLEGVLPKRFIDIIKAREWTFVKKHGKLFPASKIAVNFDSYLKNPKHPQKTAFFESIINAYNQGVYVNLYCTSKKEEEVLKMLGKKIYRNFYSGFKYFDEKTSKMCFAGDMDISLDDSDFFANS